MGRWRPEDSAYAYTYAVVGVAAVDKPATATNWVGNLFCTSSTIPVPSPFLVPVRSNTMTYTLGSVCPHTNHTVTQPLLQEEEDAEAGLGPWSKVPGPTSVKYKPHGPAVCQDPRPASTTDL